LLKDSGIEYEGALTKSYDEFSSLTGLEYLPIHKQPEGYVLVAQITE